MRSSGVLLVGFAALLYSLHALREHYFESNQCTLIRSWASYISLHVDSPSSKNRQNYDTLLFCKDDSMGSLETVEDIQLLGGTPVLFVPGNSGSYNQGGSLATLASTEEPELDWFLLDFDSDLSAVSGALLLDEAHYVNDVIRHILGLYENHERLHVKPTSVIIVAHSMGGIVARALETLPNYVNGSVNTIITLSSPHVYPPLTQDRTLVQIYDHINEIWQKNHSTTLVSLSGGHSDLMVLPDMSIVDSFGGISAFSYEVPGVQIGIDHIAMTWCTELRHAVIEALGAIHDNSSPQRTVSDRNQVLRSRLKNNTEATANVKQASRWMLVGFPQLFAIATDTELVLPARSSLVSYRVRSDKPVHLIQRAADEHRDYGETQHSTLMWYSSGPFTPTKEDEQRLKVEILPRELSTVRISVDWGATAANIAMHYRVLLACWPPAIALLTLMLSVHYQVSFGSALSLFMSRWFAPLSGLLALLHVALCSTAGKTALTRFRGFYKGTPDAHNILIGADDPTLMWLLPVLLAAACCGAWALQILTCLVVAVKPKLKLPRVPWPVMAAMFLAQAVATHVLSYQVFTFLVALWQLCHLSDTQSIEFGFVQVLLWAAVMQIPAVIVTIQNLNLRWLWAFASGYNAGSVLLIWQFSLTSLRFTEMTKISTRLIEIWALLCALYLFVLGALESYMLHFFVHILAGLFVIGAG